jgi:hypothetical protein
MPRPSLRGRLTRAAAVPSTGTMKMLPGFSQPLTTLVIPSMSHITPRNIRNIATQ